MKTIALQLPSNQTFREARTADHADDLMVCRCGLELVRKAFTTLRQKKSGCPSCLCPITL